MNIDTLIKLLQNPQMLMILKPILVLVIKQLVEELNKPEVQTQIVDAIMNTIPKQN